MREHIKSRRYKRACWDYTFRWSAVEANTHTHTLSYPRAFKSILALFVCPTWIILIKRVDEEICALEREREDEREDILILDPWNPQQPHSVYITIYCVCARVKFALCIHTYTSIKEFRDGAGSLRELGCTTFVDSRKRNRPFSLNLP